MSIYRSGSGSVHAAGSGEGTTTLDLTSHEVGVPLGMLLAPSSAPSGGDREEENGGAAPPASSSNVTLVAGWEHGGAGGGNHRGNHNLGPIQRSGLVRLGDRLVRVNGRDVTDWTFREVMDALKELVTSPATRGGPSSRPSRLRSLGFARPGTPEWARNVDPDILPGDRRDSTLLSALLRTFHVFNPWSEECGKPVVHHRRGYTFVSFVGGWRIASEDDAGDDGGTASGERPVGSGAGASESLLDDADRNHSEGSADPLEEQLRKQPSVRFHGPAGPDDGGAGGRPGDEADRAGSASSSSPSRASRSYVQYEVQCHILLRQDGAAHLQPHLSPSSPRTRSWSVWRRYSEFRSLDSRLRDDFGWQIEQAGGGRGIPFPGTRPAESWWYRTRNGGGYLTAVMGDSGATEETGEKDDGDDDEEGASWTNLYGLWRSPSNSSNKSGDRGPASPARQQQRAAPPASPPQAAGRGSSASPSAGGGATSCPYPRSFIRRRRSELASYWTRLMEVEDVFDFTDASSHRFGSAMAGFLGAGAVLGEERARGGERGFHGAGTGPADVGHHRRRGGGSVVGVLPIMEDEPMPMDSPYRGSGEFGGLTIDDGGGGGPLLHPDDDVSLLSDGTGNYSGGGMAMGYNRRRVSGGPGRVVVDVLPHGLAGRARQPPGASVSSRSARGDGVGGGGGTAASVSSSSTRRRMGRGVKAARPAFQRQFDM